MNPTCNSVLSAFFQVFLISTILFSTSQSQSRLDAFPDFDRNVGTIDISSAGRTDIQTILNLSPWELFVLNDLIFKLTIKQCPKMDTDLLTSLKKLISESLKQVPTAETQNGQFLPSYSHLVRCLEYFEEPPVGHEKAKQPTREVNLPDEQSKESDWKVTDPTTTTTTTTTTKTPYTQQEEIPLASTWLWGFRSLHHLLVDYLVSEESNEVLTSEQQQVKESFKQRVREQSMLAAESAHKGARQNFADFFHEMSKVIYKTCPVIRRSDKLFMRNALMDIATWATTEQTDAISLAALYFKKHELLKLIQQCFKML